jgi:hypothetical protein
MEDVGIFYGHLVHFTAFCYIFWTFVIVRDSFVCFFPFWYFVAKIIWQPCYIELEHGCASGLVSKAQRLALRNGIMIIWWKLEERDNQEQLDEFMLKFSSSLVSSREISVKSCHVFDESLILSPPTWATTTTTGTTTTTTAAAAATA